MSNENNNEIVKELNVSEIFDGDKTQYIVPIYQRNYAWENNEIEQLIKDIEDVNEDKSYYLGTLIVNEQKNNLFEVIDGQQRLTTLYLIKKYFDENFDKNADKLQFEAREKYKRTFQDLRNIEGDKNNYYAQEIINGKKCISDYFNEKKINTDNFKTKLTKVFIVRVQVPKNIDLNHYFEIMNTRGEQLEPHEIVKAKILGELPTTKDKIVAAQIWEKCSDMNHYIQMNFEYNSSNSSNNVREKIFSEKWDKFKCSDFDSIRDAIICKNDKENKENVEDLLINFMKDIENKKEDDIKKFFDNNSFPYEKIKDIFLQKKIKNKDLLYKIQLESGSSLEDVINFSRIIPKYPQDANNEKNSNDKKEKERFESIISFPNFLLQVNAIVNNKSENDTENREGFLDDKKFLDLMEENYMTEEKTGEKAKKFIFNMLKYRFLFDKYILKRDYDKNKNEGEWSLQRLKIPESQQNGEYKSPSYVGTFNKRNKSENTSNEQESPNNTRLKMLQATLRITYTSPKTMKWITELLKYVGRNENITCEALIDELENFCRDAVIKAAFKNNKFTNKKYGELERIVFSYLDYLLYRDGYKNILLPQNSDWKCVYRNSIEHFSPQTGGDFSNQPNILHSFGNLALITVSGNSKFSNMTPGQKIDKENDNIINQSLKLKIMAILCKMNNNVWNEKIVEDHQKDMIEILKNDIDKL